MLCPLRCIVLSVRDNQWPIMSMKLVPYQVISEQQVETIGVGVFSWTIFSEVALEKTEGLNRPYHGRRVRLMPSLLAWLTNGSPETTTLQMGPENSHQSQIEYHEAATLSRQLSRLTRMISLLSMEEM
jgi:hypothetical protein